MDSSVPGRYTKPYRLVGGLVLLAIDALLLVVAAAVLVPGPDMGLAEETQYVFGYAIDATTIGLPVLAVLITSCVAPVVRRAKTFALIALVEYGVTAILGLVSTAARLVFVQQYSKGINQYDTHPTTLTTPSTITGLFGRLALIALVCVAGLVVLRVFRAKQDPTASQYSRPYRRIDGLALLVIDAVLLLVAAVNLIPDRDMRLTAALSNGFDGIIDATTIGLPLLAVLIINRVAPVVRRAKTFALIALIEYGVTMVLGLISMTGGLLDDLNDVRSSAVSSRALPSTITELCGRLALIALVSMTGVVVLWVSWVLTGERPSQVGSPGLVGPSPPGLRL